MPLTERKYTIGLAYASGTNDVTDAITTESHAWAAVGTA